MGIYKRADSPFWWMALERPGQRPLCVSTGIPWNAGSSQQNAEQKRQATEHYALKKAELVRSSLGLKSRPTITFNKYADWYQANVVVHRRGAARDGSRLKVLRATFGPMPLATITSDTIREWMTARVGDGLKPATVNRELDVLKAMLTTAVPKYLEQSPGTGIRRLRVPEAEPRVLSPAEESRMLAVASDEERAMLIVAIDSLLRLSNVVNLKWAQVKFSSGVIVPLNAKVSHDRVPITTRMRQALKRLPRRDAHVFASIHASGSGPTASKNRAIRAFDDLCQKARVPHGRKNDGVTFHSLRHTGATRATQAGASQRTVMKLGGWRDMRSVLRYQHAADVDVQRAAESIGQDVKTTLPFTPRLRSKKSPGNAGGNPS